jgi:hypothetical protein
MGFKRSAGLFGQFTVFEKEFMDHFIRQSGQEFLHKYRAFAGKGQHQGSFLFPDSPQNMVGTFISRHHLAFVHRGFTVRIGILYSGQRCGYWRS